MRKTTLIAVSIVSIAVAAYAPNAQATVARDCWAEFTEEALYCPREFPENLVCGLTAEVHLLRCIADVISG